MTTEEIQTELRQLAERIKASPDHQDHRQSAILSILHSLLAAMAALAEIPLNAPRCAVYKRADGSMQGRH